MSRQKREKIVMVIGETYHCLKLLSFVGYSRGNKIGLFECSCGKVVEKAVTNVVYGGTKSCGHLLEQSRNNYTKAKVKYIDKKEGMFDWDAYGDGII